VVLGVIGVAVLIYLASWGVTVLIFSKKEY